MPKSPMVSYKDADTTPTLLYKDIMAHGNGPGTTYLADSLEKFYKDNLIIWSAVPQPGKTLSNLGFSRSNAISWSLLPHTLK